MTFRGCRRETSGCRNNQKNDAKFDLMLQAVNAVWQLNYSYQDIPKLIALYNEHSFTGGGFIAPMALSAFGEGKQPADCLGCRSCEAVCPQNIKISEVLADFSKKL